MANIKTPHFKKALVSDNITQHALVLIANDGRVLRPIGTAVFIAPELAITARHVIEGSWGVFEQRSLPRHSQPVHCRFGFLGIQHPGSGDVPAVWEMTRAWCAPFTDVAFLEFRPADDAARSFKWTETLGLSLLPPGHGEAILGFGYPGTVAERDFSTTDAQTISYGLNPRSTMGEVLRVHPVFRDRGMISFPCFETNARFDAGMSGGPLFNEQGRICGLIGASRPSAEPDRHRSWGITLWPAMVTELEFEGPGVQATGPYPAFQLITADVIHCAEDWNLVGRRISYSTHGDGRVYLSLRASD